jgi:protein-S-isoprenylcysteine O-methyltransferase Ste14
MQAELTTRAPSRFRGPAWLARVLRPGNLAPACVWWFMIVAQVTNSGFPPTIATAGLLLINTVFLVLFMVRRDAKVVGGALDLAVALAGTCLVALLADQDSFGDPPLVPTVVQVAGIAGWAWALISLGRSFGIVAADRGLVQHGPYRFIRHPVYAFEILFFLGYLGAVPTPRSFIIIGAWIVFQCLRIVREERIIAGYGDYAGNVRRRLIPFVW